VPLFSNRMSRVESLAGGVGDSPRFDRVLESEEGSLMCFAASARLPIDRSGADIFVRESRVFLGGAVGAARVNIDECDL